MSAAPASTACNGYSSTWFQVGDRPACGHDWVVNPVRPLQTNKQQRSHITGTACLLRQCALRTHRPAEYVLCSGQSPERQAAAARRCSRPSGNVDHFWATPGATVRRYCGSTVQEYDDSWASASVSVDASLQCMLCCRTCKPSQITRVTITCTRSRAFVHAGYLTTSSSNPKSCPADAK